MKKLSGTWPNLERNEVDRGIDCATRPILTTRQRLPPSFGGAAGVSVHLYSIWLRGRGYEVQGVRTLAYFGELAHQDINQNIPDCLQLDHPVRAFPAIQRGQLIARRGGKGFGRSTGLLPRSPRGLRRK